MSFYHERLESKMRNLIIVKYDITRTELLSAQSLKSNCSVYVDTPRVILLATVFFIKQPDMVIIELYKPLLPIWNTLGENEEFSKSKTTKLFYFTRESRLMFQF